MLHPIIPTYRAIVASAALFLAATPVLTPAARAQQPSTDSGAAARLQGIVVLESTYQPVESATVSLVGTDIEALTGRWGAFSFPTAPLGSVSLRVTVPGHPSMVQDVEVRAGRVAFVQVVLPSISAVLAELLVQTNRHAGPSVAGALTAADLLAIKVPRANIRPETVGQNDVPILLRGANTLLRGIEPLILINGVMVSRRRAFDALDQISASDVLEIEVLKGPAASSRYPFAANGVVNVKTRTGSGTR